MYIKEATPLAGIMPAIGVNTPNHLFITQFTHPTKFAGTKYALSNDIITDRILSKDDIDNTLKLRDTKEFLEDCNIKVFKYVGDRTLNEIYNVIIYAINNNIEIAESFIYETVTGRSLLSDDQLSVDPSLLEVDPNKINESIDISIHTLIEGYANIIGNETLGVPIMSSSELYEAERLLEGVSDHISIYESVKGYYAVNENNGRRTGYYQKISELPVDLL